MGCWNETCQLTNLPISNGERVVMFPLTATIARDEWLPVELKTLTLPIFGSYDDYGFIEDVEDDPELELFMKAFSRYYKFESLEELRDLQHSNPTVGRHSFAFGFILREVWDGLPGKFGFAERDTQLEKALKEGPLPLNMVEWWDKNPTTMAIRQRLNSWFPYNEDETVTHILRNLAVFESTIKKLANVFFVQHLTRREFFFQLGNQMTGYANHKKLAEWVLEIANREILSRETESITAP